MHYSFSYLTLLYFTLSHLTLLYRTFLYFTLLYRLLSYFTLQFLILLYPTSPSLSLLTCYFTLPFFTLLYFSVPYKVTLLYFTVPYLTLSYLTSHYHNHYVTLWTGLTPNLPNLTYSISQNRRWAFYLPCAPRGATHGRSIIVLPIQSTKWPLDEITKMTTASLIDGDAILFTDNRGYLSWLLRRQMRRNRWCICHPL